MRSIYSMMLFVAITNMFSVNAHGQGGWNIKYLPVDSINESLLGREVRIDFKSNPSDRIKGRVINIRKMLANRDTVNIEIAGHLMQFVENWKIYIDLGSFADQTLESVKDKNNGTELIIREMFIRGIGKSSVTLEIYTYHSNDFDRSEVQEIIIEKSLIKGILVKF